MEPRIVERKEEQALGVMTRIDPRTADYRDIWGNRFTPRMGEIAPLASRPGFCGVYYGTGEEWIVDFVAGMTVRPDAAARAVPEGLVLRAIPGGTYAAVRCTMATIGPTWDALFHQWLPASPYAEDPSRPGIEEYPPEHPGPDMPVTIYVAVKPR